MKKVMFFLLLLPFFAHSQWLYNGNHIYYNNGYVGVGTTTPSQRLEVIGKVLANSNNGGFQAMQSPDKYNEFTTGPNGEMIFYQRSYQGYPLWIKENGYVGMGTISPQAPLHLVKGWQELQFGTGTNTSGYTLSVGVNDDGINFSNNSTDRGFNFTNQNGRLLSILSNGNVGIGTGNPVAQLDLFNKNQHLSFLTNQRLNGSWPPVEEATTMTIQSSGMYPGSLAFASGNYEIMRITNAGNVGIGVTAPAQKLSVAGDVRLDGKLFWDYEERAVQVVTADDGVSKILQLRNSMSAGTANPKGGIDFATNDGTSIMRIINGNVGIGTTIPTEKLSVDGSIRTRKVIVTQTGWPDYVFEPSYQLPTLDSVSSFIQANKHLPDMPSAATVEKDGHDLGEVQKLLLKKMEEMTLYMIEIKKENIHLKNQNEQLIKDVDQLKILLKK